VGYLGNLVALLGGGQVRGDEYARFISHFANDPAPEVLTSLMTDIAVVRQSFVVPALADAYAAYVRKTLGPALTTFGLTRREGESDAVSLARPALMLFLADDGKDPRVLAFADSLARRHLESPGSVDPSLIGAALELHAMRGDEA